MEADSGQRIAFGETDNRMGADVMAEKSGGNVQAVPTLPVQRQRPGPASETARGRSAARRKFERRSPSKIPGNRQRAQSIHGHAISDQQPETVRGDVCDFTG